MLNPQICPEEPSQQRISHSEVPGGTRLPSPTTILHILNTTYGPESIAKAREEPEGDFFFTRESSNTLTTKHANIFHHDIPVTSYRSSHVEYLIYPSKCYWWHR